MAPIRKFNDTCGKEVKPGDLIQISRDDWSIHWAVYVGGGNVVHFVPHELWAGKGEVLKKKLEDVVKKDKWRVNNLLDEKYPPRPADEIVNKACSLMDTEMLYDLLNYNCQHFATEMRYGEPESQQVKEAARITGSGLVSAAEAAPGKEAQGVTVATAPEATIMGKLASFFLGPSTSSDSAVKIIKYFDKDGKKIKPGDLIEILRGFYNHWAVYVGDGNVVHLVAPGGGSNSMSFISDYSSGGSSGNNSSSGGGGFGKVKKEKLQDGAGNNYCRINNLLDHKYPPRPVNDIVREACSMVDTDLEYNVKKYNCEHFATQMRYGKAVSLQVWNAAVGIKEGAGAGLAVAAAGIAVGPVVAAGIAAAAVAAAAGRAAGGGAAAAAAAERQEQQRAAVKAVKQRQALKTKSN